MRDDLEKNTLSYAKTATILGQQEQNTKAAKKIVPEQQFVFRPILQK